MAERVLGFISQSLLGIEVQLQGPVGEKNVYSLHPRGRIAAVSATEQGLLVQLGAILATGNTAVVADNNPALLILTDLPQGLVSKIDRASDFAAVTNIRSVLFEGVSENLRVLSRVFAEGEGAIVTLQALSTAELQEGKDYRLTSLLEERSLSVNTTAAGGNASLMSLE